MASLHFITVFIPFSRPQQPICKSDCGSFEHDPFTITSSMSKVQLLYPLNPPPLKKYACVCLVQRKGLAKPEYHSYALLNRTKLGFWKTYLLSRFNEYFPPWLFCQIIFISNKYKLAIFMLSSSNILKKIIGRVLLSKLAEY